jgi:hypothetical protein
VDSLAPRGERTESLADEVGDPAAAAAMITCRDPENSAERALKSDVARPNTNSAATEPARIALEQSEPIVQSGTVQLIAPVPQPAARSVRSMLVCGMIGRPDRPM